MRRQILDSVLIVNECIEDRRVSGKNELISKLDLEKAYDHVNLGFFKLYVRENGVWGQMEKLDFLLCEVG